MHKTVGFELAVKMVLAADDAAQVQSIKDEIDILKQCRQNNIVSYYGCWGPDSKGRLWVLMDFCGVGSIVDLQVKTRTQFTELQIADIIANTLRALAYLHAKKIVHRDVKASNILLTKEGSG